MSAGDGSSKKHTHSESGKCAQASSFFFVFLLGLQSFDGVAYIQQGFFMLTYLLTVSKNDLKCKIKSLFFQVCKHFLIQQANDQEESSYEVSSNYSLKKTKSRHFYYLLGSWIIIFFNHWYGQTSFKTLLFIKYVSIIAPLSLKFDVVLMAVINIRFLQCSRVMG